LLGATGYIGQAFASVLQRRSWDFTTLSRNQVDYTRFDQLLALLREATPDLVINAAGFTGKPNVDACETAWADTLRGNTLLAQTVAHACLATGIPYGQVSTGCIYSGAKIILNNETRIEPDLMVPSIHQLITEHPESLRGFTEVDAPNFSFRQGPCSFYSGTKALAEEALIPLGGGFLWRLRIPFDQFDHQRNYLTKLQRYQKLYENINSLSHRFEFVDACLDLWHKRAPFGVYNMTNPGWVTTHDVASLIRKHLNPAAKYEFWSSDAEFYKLGARTPRSNCVLDSSKLLATGVRMSHVGEALESALKHWTPSV
jgi:UDP-glucose 4,6-dehydratase